VDCYVHFIPHWVKCFRAINSFEWLTLEKSYSRTKKKYVFLALNGGDSLKFGDVITAVASLAVAYILLSSVLSAVMIPVNSSWGVDVAAIVSILVSSLIIGYVFAAKIHEESRRGAIGRIVAFSTILLTFYTMALFANPYAGASLKESLESMFSTGGWTAMDWLAYSQLLLVMIVALNVVFALVFGFIGLYAGSMLRKPKKS